MLGRTQTQFHSEAIDGSCNGKPDTSSELYASYRPQIYKKRNQDVKRDPPILMALAPINGKSHSPRRYNHPPKHIRYVDAGLMAYSGIGPQLLPLLPLPASCEHGKSLWQALINIREASPLSMLGHD